MARFGTVVDALIGHSQISTAHGYRRAFLAKQDWAKVIWFIIFIVGFVAFVTLLVFLILDYNIFAAKTVVTTKTDYPAFPTVTVCNLNPVRRSLLSRDQEITLNDTREMSAELLDGKARSIYMASKIAEVANPQNGHSLTDFMLYCSFNGKMCHPTRNFTTYQNKRYGQCFSFNWDRKHPRKSVHLGPLHGLTLILNAEKYEHLPGVAESDGFRVSVHSPGSNPYPELQGFSMPTATEIMVGLREKKHKRLDEPYGHCTDQDEEDGFVYTTLSCEGKCIDKGQECSCHPPCKETEYEISFSQTKWPSENHKTTLIDMLRTRNDQIDYEQKLHEMAILKVYFKDFSKRILTQEPAYTLSRLFTQIGGLTALCIGMSVLTFFECLDMIISMSVAPSGFDSNRSDTNSLVHEASADPTQDGSMPPNVAGGPGDQPEPPDMIDFPKNNEDGTSLQEHV